MENKTGIQVKKARLHAGMSQSTLANLIGSYKANISDIENGKGNPTLKTLAAICEVLNCNIVITNEK